MKVCEETQIDFDSFEDDMKVAFPNVDVFCQSIGEFLAPLVNMELDEKVQAINTLRMAIHHLSPFKDEPVDCVQWVKNDTVTHNDYNPNKVAPPEMKLLELSIMNDGYTQPIVSWSNSDKNMIEVIDGFHRHRVGKESKVVNQRVHGYLPVVDIRTEQSSKNDRMASTIRHNRARGKHQVDAMSEIVIELKNRNWRNARIAKELGMDEEEVLRLCQISGIESLFSDADFSKAWEAADAVDDWEDLTDEMDSDSVSAYRTANTGDSNRIFHTYDKWECHKAGFFASNVEGKTAEECQQEYADFLRDSDRFRAAAITVIEKWKHSCEHYLTNTAMNRIAWIGQAAMCYETGIPSRFCSGFNLLSEDEQKTANGIAYEVLTQWLEKHERETPELDEALSIGRQIELY